MDIKIDPATQASRGFGFVLFGESSSIDQLEADTTQHHLGTYINSNVYRSGWTCRRDLGDKLSSQTPFRPIQYYI